MINHPNRKANPIVQYVRSTIGRAHRITRQQMAELLLGLHERGIVNIVDYWSGADPKADARTHARAWAAACHQITVISVMDDSDPMAARWSSSNPGSVRYDEPGSMHPQLRASVMFAPPGVDNDYLRDKARRLLIVED